MKSFIILGSVLTGIAIIIGAIGAHAIKTKVLPEDLAIFETGIKYHFYHSLGLIIIGIFSGLIASIYMRGLTGYLPIPKKIPSYLLPIIAGIICGITGLFIPEVLGLGSETIQSLLVEEKTINTLIILLFVFKFESKLSFR